MSSARALAAEFFGTFWLVLGGCGSAVFAAGFGADTNNNLGLGFLGVSFAFGLTVVTGAYAFGPVSGGHFNPAVTLGLTVAGKFEAAKAGGYILVQVVGGAAAAAVIYVIAKGADGFAIDGEAPGAFATNGYGDFSPGGYSMVAALFAEVVLTAVFLMIILGATAKAASPAMGGLAIGLTLALIHMISIPITNTSVNPARSTAMAIFAGSNQIGQLWLFWVAPIVGAVIGAVLHKALLEDPAEAIAA